MLDLAGRVDLPKGFGAIPIMASCLEKGSHVLRIQVAVHVACGVVGCLMQA